MKHFVLTGFLFILVGCSSGIHAQTRIKFGAGKTNKVITGVLKGYKDKRAFLIRVGNGQKLRTEQTNQSGNHYITVYIKSPSGEEVGDSDASCNNRREIDPTEKGDYRIEVVECQKADRWQGRFALRVSVR